MNEENKTPQPVEWVEPAPAKPRKKIRHMIWAVVLIALAMMLAGQLLGDLSMNALAAALHITDGATLFLFMYLSFWGIHLVVLLYTLLCERAAVRAADLPLLHTPRPERRQRQHLEAFRSRAARGLCDERDLHPRGVSPR